MPGGNGQFLGFPSDQAAAPKRQRREPPASETAQTGLTMHAAARQTRFWQRLPEGLFYGAGYGHGFAQIARYPFTQPTMAVGQDEWLVAFLESFLVSSQDCFTRCIRVA